MNNTSGPLAIQGHHLVQVGIALLLIAALIGLAMPTFAVPRLALSAHLVAILQGIFFLAVGQVWPRLTLGRTAAAVAFWFLIYGGIVAPAADLLAAALGAGNSMMPMAAGSAHGTTFQEAIIGFSLRSAAATIIGGLILILWGLRRLPGTA